MKYSKILNTRLESNSDRRLVNYFENHTHKRLYNIQSPVRYKNKGEKIYLHEHLQDDSLYNIRNSQIK